jgi:sortase A
MIRMFKTISKMFLGIFKNSVFFVRARKRRTQNRNVYEIHEDSSTTLTRLSRKKCIFRGVLVFLPLCGLWFIGNGSYIHAKAVLAQLLLETAWTETLSGNEEVKPWPWADTWPVARLSAPELGISRIVLAGASGSSLAFGPGHLFGSTPPGGDGNIIISGHRDTHFSFLKNIRKGEHLELQSNKKTSAYQVTNIQVIDKTKVDAIPVDSGNKLILITCYPFDAIQSGGPLRYMITAKFKHSFILS